MNRFLSLDGWRGLSILFVLAGHLLPLGPKSWQMNSSVALAESNNDFWISEALKPELSFIDLSYLNEKPAGNHGFVKAVGD